MSNKNKFESVVEALLKYEYKQFKDNELGYFGSHHFTIEVGGILAEIQVMTKKLWVYKSKAHDIYIELRSGVENYTEKEIKDKIKASKDLFMRGNNFSK